MGGRAMSDLYVTAWTVVVSLCFAALIGILITAIVWTIRGKI